MRTVTSVAAMQRLGRHWQRRGVRVGFVPTMGYLHEGHLSLARVARQRVGQRGKVVVSVYVNPTQFGPKEDLSRYPRDLKRDLKLYRAEGVDVVFAPGDAEMYPGKANGNCGTYVVEEKLSQGMEGASRPGHFRGVTTVVRAAGIPLVFWLHDPPHPRLHWLERWAKRTAPDLVLANSRPTASALRNLFDGIPSEILYCPVAAPHLPDRNREIS